MFGTLALPLDGLNSPGQGESTGLPATGATDVLGRSAQAGKIPCGRPGRAILAASSACGGIGRRARLRALWTLWSVEVRVLSGALEKPRITGLFAVSGRFQTSSKTVLYRHTGTNPWTRERSRGWQRFGGPIAGRIWATGRREPAGDVEDA